jgi:type III restriction enzyme
MSTYFVIETKMDKEIQNLTDIEKLKIRCGKLHFKAISDVIKFDWVNSYQKFLSVATIESIEVS